MKLKAVSGIMLTLLLIGMLTLAFNIQPVEAFGTIYIKADGSVEPSTANITSSDNITYTFTGDIYDSIVVERDNIVVDGASCTLQGTGGIGILLLSRSNVTIKNTGIKNFEVGIFLENSSNNCISACSMPCMYVNWIPFPSVVCGVALISSNFNSVCGNWICTECWGIYLYNSSSNSIYENEIEQTSSFGDATIYLESSSSNSIYGNEIEAAKYNIELWYSSSNSIYENNIRYGFVGIILGDSLNNTISGNNLGPTVHGIWLYSSNNSFCHNNFIDIEQPVSTDTFYANSWDDGYPSGGNYWSDYEDRYPDARELDDSGLWDTPYVINENNTDNYPLMYPWGAPPSYTLAVYSSPTGVTFTVDGVPRTTPWSETYSENASVVLEMPETHGGYSWSHWLEDEDTNRTKTVTVETKIVLTAIFVLLGDLNGDGVVDIDDVIIPALAFGSYPGHPKWNALADLTGDELVDIDDVMLVALHFGEHI